MVTCDCPYWNSRNDRHSPFCPMFKEQKAKQDRPILEAVSGHWVLSMLAGMRYPEQGQAYDAMKRSLQEQYILVQKDKPAEPIGFAHALSTFGYQLSVISKAQGRGAVHFYGGVSMRFDVIRGENDPSLSEETNRDWDQFIVDGMPIGNRCAAREEYVKRCAPVLMRISKGEL